ncbi:hypothetical protein QL285_023055 [Trifolium repens]|nr:hypothetical protein QL285_023055 [Trifolium repens]
MSLPNHQSNLVDMLTGSHKAWFCTISTASQTFGEVDPFFAAKYFEELENNWEICDGNAKQHSVEFNGSAIQPLLTTGWDTLRSHYSWTEDKAVFLFYYGGNKFFMLINNEAKYNTPNFFPTFHSMTTKIAPKPKFLMEIGSNDITATKMDVPHDMDIFLATPGLTQLRLCGPMNNVVTVRLIKNSKDGPFFQFGRGWKSFCEINQIVSGNVLQFEASLESDYSPILIVRVV